MKAVIWSKTSCTFCDAAKKLLEHRGIEYEERMIGEQYTREQLLEVVPNARTVPQIFLDEKHIGGYMELQKFLKEEYAN